MGDAALLLAIDLGTSGPKVALTTTTGRIVASTTEPLSLELSDGGGAEQDPGAWWRSIVTAAHRVLDAEPGARDRVVAMSCTGQWSGTVAVDQGGQPLHNAITWMDTRGAPHVRALLEGPVKFEGYSVGKLFRWVRLTGGVPTASGKDPIAHILYLRNERPDIYRRTHKFLEPKDYLNLRLTGRFAASYDSIALHWLTDNRDAHNIAYHPGLLRMAGLAREQLPDLCPATTVLGSLTREASRDLGLPERVQVIAGTPDVHSAAIGSGAVLDYEAHIYVGTSSWLTCHVPFKKTDVFSNMASLPAPLPGRYLIANEQETAGECLRFVRDKLFFAGDGLTGPAPDDALERMNELAAKVPPGSRGVLFLPWLYGERTPVEDPYVRGGFYNVSLSSTRADLLRSVFEGVALNSRRLLEAVERFAGRPFGHLRAIGGGMRSPLWCQIYADVLGRPIHVVESPLDANARGAALLAALGLGHLRLEDVGRSVPVTEVYEPNPEHQAVYAELYREMLQVYRANRPIFARLNRHRTSS